MKEKKGTASTRKKGEIKAWSARQNLEKAQCLLLFPVSLWVYAGTVTEKDTNCFSRATVHLQIGTSKLEARTEWLQVC